MHKIYSKSQPIQIPTKGLHPTICPRQGQTFHPPQSSIHQIPCKPKITPGSWSVSSWPWCAYSYCGLSFPSPPGCQADPRTRSLAPCGRVRNSPRHIHRTNSPRPAENTRMNHHHEDCIASSRHDKTAGNHVFLPKKLGMTDSYLTRQTTNPPRIPDGLYHKVYM